MNPTNPTKNYVTPHIRVMNIYAECSGIGIGSGDTSPEECDTNDFLFEEEQSPTIRPSVWDN